jgi:hypothetical protein
MNFGLSCRIARSGLFGYPWGKENRIEGLWNDSISCYKLYSFTHLIPDVMLVGISKCPILTI